MKAVLMRSPGGAVLADVETPAPGPGEILVEMAVCGLCGTDIEKMKGEYTASQPVLGHEAVGTVAALGDGVAGFAVGDRVFPHHHVPCHECRLCRSGSETMCDRYRGSNLVPGGFAEAFVVPKWNVENGGVLRLPPGLAFETSSLVEPLGCCVRAARRSGAKAGETALVVGAGPVGVMNALLLKGAGLEVMISDVNGSRLLLAEKLGAGMTIDASKDGAPDVAKGATGGTGVDLALVASGSAKAILQGLGAVRKGGRVCLFGIPPKGTVLDYDMSELYNAERRIVTSYGATDADAEEALRVIVRAPRSYKALVTHTFPLEKFAEAVDAATTGAGMKVVITP